MSKKGAAALQNDVPWRASSAAKPVPKIHHSPVLRVPQTPYSNYALSIMKHPDPIGNGLGMEAVLEAAGPDCIVPGQVAPIKLLGLKVWPIEIDLKFMEPVSRELKSIGRAMQDVRKGPWLKEEDEQLAAAVDVLGERRWDALAKASGLRRSGKSCRLRWMNYLRPNLKHEHITADEERVIIELHEKWGNKWSRIARRLPGRTDNWIKNYWRSYLKKKAKVLKKECFSSTINTWMNSECDTDCPCSNTGESAVSKDNNFGSSANSSDALELSNLTLSPCETRLTEWMSNWPLDISKMEPKDESWNFNIYDHQEWNSEDFCSSILDNYLSLWDGE